MEAQRHSAKFSPQCGENNIDKRRAKEYIERGCGERERERMDSRNLAIPEARMPGARFPAA